MSRGSTGCCRTDTSRGSKLLYDRHVQMQDKLLKNRLVKGPHTAHRLLYARHVQRLHTVNRLL